MQLGPDGRLVRDGLALELNPYCRRAVSEGVELARTLGGTCTAITLGPPTAEDCLREAIAWGCDDGILITDPAFAGSDTIATARALAAALARLGEWDLILTGRNSVDADTGQVGPQVAELCDMAFAAGAKEITVLDGRLRVRCEEDDGYSDRLVRLPAVISCAERLCEPAKVDPDGRAAVDGSLLSVLTAADLGSGPWGQAGSGTTVGEVRVLDVQRERRVLTGSAGAQVAEAVALLVSRGALTLGDADGGATRLRRDHSVVAEGPVIAVVIEPERANVARELLGAADGLAAEIGGAVVAVTATFPAIEPDMLGTWGADAVVAVEGAGSEEDVAAALAAWASVAAPWAVLLPSTTWGREVGGRAAAILGAGLTGDAVELEVERGSPPRLVAWKPAFGGRLVAAIHSLSPVQMATVRPGVLRPPMARPAGPIPTSALAAAVRGRVTVTSSVRDDDVDVLAMAPFVVGVGGGVPPDEYGVIEALADTLGAELAATRKVTDKAWLPRARQVGLTGRSIAPHLYIAIGLSGKFNHTVGVRAARTVLAINQDPTAPIWDHADIGIVGDWRSVVPLLTASLSAAVAVAASVAASVR